MTPSSKNGLPSFRRPPITEVVVGVAFKDAAVSTAHFGDLWRSRWEGRLPRVEEHPPYSPPLERFDMPVSGPGISLEFSTRPVTRLWFVTADGQELIQVQRDWFACNWRKVKTGDAYDRWPARRSAFAGAFGDLESYVEDQGLGKVSIVQCEVTYINHIVAGGVWSHHGELSKVLRLARTVDTMPQPEQLQVAATFVIPNEQGDPVGRLHMAAQPGVLRDTGVPIFGLNLTARGAPEGEGLEGALQFLDRGREHIVETFAEVTTPEMHEEWERDA